jgi:hypothetical protein
MFVVPICASDEGFTVTQTNGPAAQAAGECIAQQKAPRFLVKRRKEWREVSVAVLFFVALV